MPTNPYSSPKNTFGSSTTLDETAIVKRIGFAIIGVIALNTLVICLMTTGVVSAIVRGTIHVIIAVFMINGANWARWLFAIGSGFGALMGIITFFSLGKTDVGMFSFIGIWIFLMVIFEVAIALFLVFSGRVNKYFGT